MSKKQEVRKLWTDVLTSGKYRQLQGSLKETVQGRSRHCCLGVLCELYIKDTQESEKWQREGIYWTFMKEESMPPKPVLKWAGLTDSQASTLASWNDEDNLSFKQIAAKIPGLPISGETPEGEVKVRKWANQYGSGVIKS